MSRRSPAGTRVVWVDAAAVLLSVPDHPAGIEEGRSCVHLQNEVKEQRTNGWVMNVTVVGSCWALEAGQAVQALYKLKLRLRLGRALRFSSGSSLSGNSGCLVLASGYGTAGRGGAVLIVAGGGTAGRGGRVRLGAGRARLPPAVLQSWWGGEGTCSAAGISVSGRQTAERVGRAAGRI